MGGVSVGPEERKEIHAGSGSGPLLQRDYSGVIEGTNCSPEELAKFIRERFIDLAPQETAAFENSDGGRAPLKVGDELKIRIGGFMPCQVRVVHVDDVSLTLRTLEGHPEAGRVSFGAGRDDEGRLTFRIRSRARSGGLIHYLGFLMMGRAMQARCWIRFIGRAAEICGGRLAGPVRVSTTKVAEEPADVGGPDLPTFLHDTGH
jgi:hypothetical protein